MNDTTRTHVQKISQLTLIIALFALVAFVILYAVLRSQSEKQNTNTQSTTGSVLTNQQISEMNTTYEQAIAELVSAYMSGSATAQATLLDIESVRVTSAYKQVHAQLSSLFASDTSEETKKEQLRTLDASYTWLIQ